MARIAGRLAPVVSMLAGEEVGAPGVDRWEAVVNEGTPGLQKWARETGLLSEIECYIGGFPQRFDERPEDRNVQINRPLIPTDSENRRALQVQLLTSCVRWTLRNWKEPVACRILLWLATCLETAEYVDMAVVSRRLLPLDVGASPSETEQGYRFLCEHGVVEVVDYLPTVPNPDCFRVRIALLGDNASKYPQPYRRVKFGEEPAEV